MSDLAKPRICGALMTVKDFPLPSFRRVDGARAYAIFRDECQSALEEHLADEFGEFEVTVVTMKLTDPVQFDIRFGDHTTVSLTDEQIEQGQALAQVIGERMLRICEAVANQAPVIAPRIITDIGGVQ